MSAFPYLTRIVFETHTAVSRKLYTRVGSCYTEACFAGNVRVGFSVGTRGWGEWMWGPSACPSFSSCYWAICYKSCFALIATRTGTRPPHPLHIRPLSLQNGGDEFYDNRELRYEYNSNYENIAGGRSWAAAQGFARRVAGDRGGTGAGGGGDAPWG